MDIVNGTIVLGTRACFRCDGAGQTMLWKPCPSYGRATYGKPCAHCRATRKHAHQYLEAGVGPCPSCAGTGEVPETMSDRLSVEQWTGLPFQVYRSDRPQTLNEALLGVNCVYSCTDYGRAAGQPDEEVIASVRAARNRASACTVSHEGRLADHIGIFVNRNGYSVRPVYLVDGQPALALTTRYLGLGGETRQAVEATGGF